MKSWIVFFIVAVLLAAGAFTSEFWVPTLLRFVGANTDTIQGFDSLVQLLFALGSILSGLLAYLRRGELPPVEAVQKGRDSVGRDKKTHAEGKSTAIDGDVSESTIINAETVVIAEKILDSFSHRSSKPNLEKATTAYLDYLLSRHRYLNFKGMGVSDRVPLRLPLLDLYVPLKAHLEMPEGETWKRGLRLAGRELADDDDAEAMRLSEPQPVLDLLQEHDGLIILGDPGAGKTTFLKYVALSLAVGKSADLGLGERLPILVPLSAYANALGEDDIRLDDFIAEFFHDIGSDLPIGVLLAEALDAGAALILLDGLDEVKEVGLRHTVVERVTDFYAFHRQTGNKFILTSRVIGYRSVRPNVEGLAECTLVDFEEDEIESFVHRWTSALEKQAQGETVVAQTDAQREQEELLEAIHQNPGVRQLAANPLLLTILALMKRQGVTLPERRVELYDQYVRTLLSTWNRARSLSGRAPSRDPDVIRTLRILAPLALWMHEVSPGVGLVKRQDLRRKLVALFQERGEHEPEVAASSFLMDVRDYAALLLERGSGQYGFIHLTFEEYLAAVAIALDAQGDARPVVDYLNGVIGEQAWREVVLLTVSYLGIIQQLDTVAGEVVETLVEEKPGEPGEAAVLSGEAVLDAYPQGVPPRSKTRVMEALVETMQSAEVSPELRRRAGLLLGSFGWRPNDLDAFVEVPAGTFLYGDDKDEREISYRYWVTKYPVTNAQYTRFIQAGGYQQQDYWSEAGWQQREKKSWEQPRYWKGEYSNPIFPVVGVSWYEAEAYCNWLARQELTIPIPKGYTVRLPTEEEWERAARGTDGREYPWMDEFDFIYANVSEEMFEGIGTTAICTYPQGESPTGAWDMSGNVFEWTNSWFDQERKYRVVRGGSCISYHRYARCAFRFRYYPRLGDNFNGFRVVVSLADSDF
ncbi:MAG: SUMF1/EgtB/PvdO family nonheme iron enzyme [Chloroflexota bacterium]|nr:SUMF1/EgtB/PvdO family nonheme iron enzyme [Chloroflexota bacterium]